MENISPTEVDIPLIGRITVFRYKNESMTERRYVNLRSKKGADLYLLQNLLEQDHLLSELSELASAIGWFGEEREHLELPHRRYKVLSDAGLATPGDKPRLSTGVGPSAETIS